MRVALMLLATLCGVVAGACAFAWLFGLLDPDASGSRTESPGPLAELAMGLYVCAFGGIVVFPSALLLLAVATPASASIARLALAPAFGAACGAIAAALIWFVVGSEAVLLDASSTGFFATIGAVVGLVTWTSYVLLARWRAAREVARRS